MKNGYKQWFEEQYRRYDRFIDKQGFYIVLAVCLLVIVISAVYTSKLRDTLENPVLAQDTGASSAVSQRSDQSLKQAQELIMSQITPVAESEPTAAPVEFSAPVAGAVIRGYSTSRPEYFEAARAYAVHLGLDISARYGDLVSACGDGSVTDISEKTDMGLCVTISHRDGLETRYCGLSEAPYVRAGDTVRKGQTIGHVGNGVLIEKRDGAHLHIEVRKNGAPVDPQTALGIFTN